MRGTASDEELLQRLRAGDEAAFAALYARRNGAVHRFALRMSGSPSVAEDVTQEAFLVLIREPERFDPARGTLVSFLYGVARNHVLRRLERERAYVPLGGSTTAVRPDPLEGLIQRERTELIWRALLCLPPRYREVVVLCELERLSYAEAAGILGCAVGTVRSRLHRGRGLLGARVRARDPRTEVGSGGKGNVDDR